MPNNDWDILSNFSKTLVNNGDGTYSLKTSGGGGGSTSIGGTVTSGTTGSVLYVGSGPVLAQDNSNFFWDATNHRLGIGTTGPGYPLDVNGNTYIRQNLGIGTVPNVYNNAGSEYTLDMGRTWTDNTGSATKRGINSLQTITVPNDATQYYQAILSQVNITSTSTNSGYVHGIQATVFERGNGTTSEVTAGHFNVGTFNGGSDSTGSITNAYAVQALGYKTTSSNIANMYGFYANGIQGTNAYDLYMSDAGAKNYIAGNVGIGTTSPTAKLHLAAGTATASTAPIKLTSGTLLTAPEAGTIEFVTDTLSFTITTGTARKTIAFTDTTMVNETTKNNAYCDVSFYGATYSIDNTYPFTKITFHSQTGYNLVDVGSNYSAANDWYVVPTTGYYKVVTKLRMVDGVGAGAGYGQGSGTSNVDSATFMWFVSTGGRNHSLNVITRHLTAGDHLYMFAYGDGAQNYASGDMTIELLSIG